MKNLYFLSFFLVLFYSCTIKKDKSDYIIEINVEKNYEEKIIYLQDIANVKYVPLKTNEGYITTSRPRIIRDNFILLYDFHTNQILIFDSNGNTKSRFSRYGNGPGEYLSASSIIYDEKYKELFIRDSFLKKILVYDLNGHFKRDFPFKLNSYYVNIAEFDDKSLICYNSDPDHKELGSSYLLISKQNGSVLKEIKHTFNKILDLSVIVKTESGTMTFSSDSYPIVRINDGFLLSDLSSDTIYKLSYNLDYKPYIVRKPSILTMNPPVFLRACLETSKYLLYSVVKKEWNENNEFPSKAYVFNKETKRVNEQKIVNKDFPMCDIFLDPGVINYDIDSNHGLIRLNAEDLVTAYNENKLQGELKIIARNLIEDDNQVLMFLDFK